MEHRRETDDHLCAGDLLGVSLLGLNQIHHRVGQRTVIADRTGQHEWDIVFDALIHYAGSQDPSLDGTLDRSVAVDRIDRPHMVLVPLLDRNASLEIDPK